MICAVVLAAGESKRMGQPKMLMPWGDKTVIGASVAAVVDGGAGRVGEVVVVCGAYVELIREAIANARLAGKAHCVVNLQYKNDDLIQSLRVGLGAIILHESLAVQTTGVLVCLGDQPQLDPAMVGLIVERHLQRPNALIVPSWNMRRGHPWMVPASLLGELANAAEGMTPRDFLAKHEGQIEYVEANETVLKDLDTPQDYLRETQAQYPDKPA